MNSIESLREDIEKLQTHKNNGQGYIAGFHRCKKEALKVIDNLEHLGKPEIPDYVAEWIEGDLKENHGRGGANTKGDMVYIVSRFGYGQNLNTDVLYKDEKFTVKGDKNRKLLDYVSDNKLKVIKAITDGYVIEKKLYEIKNKHDQSLLIKVQNTVQIYSDDTSYHAVEHTLELTEEEIKGFDEHYWVFAKPIGSIQLCVNSSHYM